MFMSHEQNAGHNHNKNVGYKKAINSFKIWQNSNTLECLQIKTALMKNEEQTEFRECLLTSVQNVLSACLHSKNIKIKLCRTVILSSYMGVKLGLSN